MKNSTKGFVAGAAGVGLLLGASTFALWSDSETVSGAQISSGDLAVNVTDTEWHDISTDGTSTHIVPADFAIVPGDKIQGTYNVKIDHEGDNLRANLKLVNGGNFDGSLGDGLTTNYDIQKMSGEEVESTSTEKGVEFDLPADVPEGVATDEWANYQVVVEVEFDKDTSGRDLTDTGAWLSAAQIELEQVDPEAVNAAGSDN